LTLLSPSGRATIQSIIDQAKRERGSGWIEAIKAEYPMACWIIELAANYEAEAAYNAVAEAYPHYPLYLAKRQIIDLHAFLREQIDRPRAAN